MLRYIRGSYNIRKPRFANLSIKTSNQVIIYSKIDEGKEKVCQFLTFVAGFLFCLLMIPGILHIMPYATEVHLDNSEKNRSKNYKHFYGKMYM